MVIVDDGISLDDNSSNIYVGGIGTTLNNPPIGQATTNIGSGLINLRIGSGICMFRPSASQVISTTINTFTKISFDTRVVRDDNFFFRGNDVLVTASGLYKVDYSVGVQKIAGTTAAGYAARIVKNNVPVLNWGISYAQTTNLNPSKSTLHGFGYLNLRTNDQVGIQIGFEGTWNASQTASTIPSGTYMTLEYIGPIREVTL